MTATSPPTRSINERAHLFAMAGLLHDVGKVFERTGIDLGDRHTRLESLLCPTDARGRPTHRHVLFTAYALDQIRSNFGGLDPQRLFVIACNHHRPTGSEIDEHILTHADRLASGHDRRKRSGPEPADHVTSLASVLARLGERESSERGNRRAFFPPGRLSYESDRFLPAATAPAPAEYWRRCEELGAALIGSMSRDFPDPAAAVEGTQAICRSLLSRVPASRITAEVPDVSLYDHSRVVAAFASCLGVLYSGGPGDTERLQGRYRIVAAAIGGIQRFIFRTLPPVDALDPTEKGRARRLRANSWLVSMLAHLAARRILDATGMPWTNCLFDAGGRVLMLLPEDPEVLAAAQEAMQFCRGWMLDHFSGALRLDMGISDALADGRFRSDAFADTYSHIAALPTRGRVLHAAEPLRSASGWSDAGWIGHQPGLPIDAPAWRTMMTDLGRALTRADCVTIDSPSPGALWEGDLMGYRVALCERDGMPSGGRALVLTEPQDPADHALLNLGFVPTERSPDGDLEPVTFDDLASRATDDDGTPAPFPMLAALKADVDDLGFLVGAGMGDDISLGRLATLSRLLDDFFKGYLPALLRAHFPMIYTVFGGGDDLFIIGPWLDVIRLAGRLQRDLASVSGHNPAVTISGGIAFAQPGVPIRSLATSAAQNLNLAKRGIGDAHLPPKNALVIGSTRLGWGELPTVLARHRLLFELMCTQVLPSAGVYRLYRYAQMALKAAALQRSNEPVPLHALKWRSQMAYDLRRNLPEDDQSPLLPDLRRWLLALTPDQANVLSLAAILALYRIRGVQQHAT